MSELKAHLFVPYSELTEGDELTDDFAIAKSYYLKSEADKVIADLEESHKKEVDQLWIVIAELKEQVNDYAQGLYVMQARAEKEARHQKHKRCLDNAEICCEKKENCYNRAMRKYSKNEADYLVCKSDFWQDWEFRWLKIAEKFKEAK